MEIRGQALKARGSGLAASVFMTRIGIFNMFPGEVDAAFAHTSTANYRRVWLLSHFYTASWSAAVSGAACEWQTGKSRNNSSAFFLLPTAFKATLSMLKLDRRLTTPTPRPNSIPPITNLLSIPALVSSTPSILAVAQQPEPRFKSEPGGSLPHRLKRSGGMAFVNLVVRRRVGTPCSPPRQVADCDRPPPNPSSHHGLEEAEDC